MDATRNVSHLLAQIQQNLQCSICLEMLNNPVTTKCYHNFCSFCISKFLATKRQVPCPLCNTTVTKRSLQEKSELSKIADGVKKLIEAFEEDIGKKYARNDRIETVSTPPNHQIDLTRSSGDDKSNSNILSKTALLNYLEVGSISHPDAHKLSPLELDTSSDRLVVEEQGTGRDERFCRKRTRRNDIDKSNRVSRVDSSLVKNGSGKKTCQLDEDQAGKIICENRKSTRRKRMHSGEGESVGEKMLRPLRTSSRGKCYAEVREQEDSMNERRVGGESFVCKDDDLKQRRTLNKSDDEGHLDNTAHFGNDDVLSKGKKTKNSHRKANVENEFEFTPIGTANVTDRHSPMSVCSTTSTQQLEKPIQPVSRTYSRKMKTAYKDSENAWLKTRSGKDGDNGKPHNDIGVDTEIMKLNSFDENRSRITSDPNVCDDVIEQIDWKDTGNVIGEGTEKRTMDDSITPKSRRHLIFKTKSHIVKPSESESNAEHDQDGINSQDPYVFKGGGTPEVQNSCQNKRARPSRKGKGKRASNRIPLDISSLVGQKKRTSVDYCDVEKNDGDESVMAVHVAKKVRFADVDEGLGRSGRRHSTLAKEDELIEVNIGVDVKAGDDNGPNTLHKEIYSPPQHTSGKTETKDQNWKKVEIDKEVTNTEGIDAQCTSTESMPYVDMSDVVPFRKTKRKRQRVRGRKTVVIDNDIHANQFEKMKSKINEAEEYELMFSTQEARQRMECESSKIRNGDVESAFGFADGIDDELKEDGRQCRDTIAVDDNKKNSKAVDDNKKNSKAVDDNEKNPKAVDDNKKNPKAVDNKKNPKTVNNKYKTKSVDDNKNKTKSVDDNKNKTKSVVDNEKMANSDDDVEKVIINANKERKNIKVKGVNDFKKKTKGVNEKEMANRAGSVRDMTKNVDVERMTKDNVSLTCEFDGTDSQQGKVLLVDEEKDGMKHGNVEDRRLDEIVIDTGDDGNLQGPSVGKESLNQNDVMEGITTVDRGNVSLVVPEKNVVSKSVANTKPHTSSNGNGCNAFMLRRNVKSHNYFMPDLTKMVLFQPEKFGSVRDDDDEVDKEDDSVAGVLESELQDAQNTCQTHGLIPTKNDLYSESDSYGKRGREESSATIGKVGVDGGYFDDSPEKHNYSVLQSTNVQQLGVRNFLENDDGIKRKDCGADSNSLDIVACSEDKPVRKTKRGLAKKGNINMIHQKSLLSHQRTVLLESYKEALSKEFSINDGSKMKEIEDSVDIEEISNDVIEILDGTQSDEANSGAGDGNCSRSNEKLVGVNDNGNDDDDHDDKIDYDDDVGDHGKTKKDGKIGSYVDNEFVDVDNNTFQTVEDTPVELYNCRANIKKDEKIGSHMENIDTENEIQTVEETPMEFDNDFSNNQILSPQCLSKVRTDEQTSVQVHADEPDATKLDAVEFNATELDVEPNTTELDEEPNATELEEPNDTELEEPNATELEEPNTTELEEPNATELEEPNATELEEPNATELEEPNATEPEEPNATELEEPNATELEEPNATELEEPNATELDASESDVMELDVVETVDPHKCSEHDRDEDKKRLEEELFGHESSESEMEEIHFDIELSPDDKNDNNTFIAPPTIIKLKNDWLETDPSSSLSSLVSVKGQGSNAKSQTCSGNINIKHSLKLPVTATVDESDLEDSLEHQRLSSSILDKADVSSTNSIPQEELELSLIPNEDVPTQNDQDDVDNDRYMNDSDDNLPSTEESNDSIIGIKRGKPRRICSESDEDRENDQVTISETNLTSSSAYSTQSEILNTEQRETLEKDVVELQQNIADVEACLGEREVTSPPALPSTDMKTTLDSPLYDDERSRDNVCDHEEDGNERDRVVEVSDDSDEDMFILPPSPSPQDKTTKRLTSVASRPVLSGPRIPDETSDMVKQFMSPSGSLHKRRPLLEFSNSSAKMTTTGTSVKNPHLFEISTEDEAKDKTHLDESSGSKSPVIHSQRRSSGQATPTAPVSNYNKSCHIVASGLNAHEMKLIHKLTVAFPNVQFSRTFQSGVTHLIMQTVPDMDRVCDRTLKYFQALSLGVWIVSPQWMVESLQAGKMVNEKHYEVLGDTSGGERTMGPRKARLATEKLFKDYGMACVGDSPELPRDSMEELIKICGASLEQDVISLPMSVREKKVIVRCSDSELIAMEKAMLNGVFESTGVVTVKRDWVLDCISSYQIAPLDIYLLSG